MKNAIKILVLSLFFITFKFHAQEIFKVENNNRSLNESIAKKAIDVMNITDVIFIKNNGKIKYGSQNSMTLYVDYENIDFGNSINQATKNNIKNIIVKIPDNYSGSISLNSLNMFPAINFIYLIVEKNSTDIALTSSIVESNPNWTIAYQISLPE